MYTNSNYANYWNIYQTELKGRLMENLTKVKLGSMERIKKYAVMNELDILKKVMIYT